MGKQHIFLLRVFSSPSKSLSVCIFLLSSFFICVSVHAQTQVGQAGLPGEEPLPVGNSPPEKMPTRAEAILRDLVSVQVGTKRERERERERGRARESELDGK